MCGLAHFCFAKERLNPLLIASTAHSVSVAHGPSKMWAASTRADRQTCRQVSSMSTIIGLRSNDWELGIELDRFDLLGHSLDKAGIAALAAIGEPLFEHVKGAPFSYMKRTRSHSTRCVCHLIIAMEPLLKMEVRLCRVL